MQETIFDFRYVGQYDIDIPKEKWFKEKRALANSVDPDIKTSQIVTSDQGRLTTHQSLWSFCVVSQRKEDKGKKS